MTTQWFAITFKIYILTVLVCFVDGIDFLSELYIRTVHYVEILVIHINSLIPVSHDIKGFRLLILYVRIGIGQVALSPEYGEIIWTAMAFF